MLSAKNYQFSPASVDLGLSDTLKSQLEDEEEERKKKLLKQANMMGSFSPAAQSLFPGLA